MANIIAGKKEIGKFFMHIGAAGAITVDLKCTAPGAANTWGGFCYSECAIENILQINVETVKQAALEMGNNRRPLLLGHLRKLPVGIKRVHFSRAGSSI